MALREACNFERRLCVDMYEYTLMYGLAKRSYVLFLQQGLLLMQYMYVHGGEALQHRELPPALRWLSCAATSRSTEAPGPWCTGAAALLSFPLGLGGGYSCPSVLLVLAESVFSGSYLQ